MNKYSDSDKDLPEELDSDTMRGMGRAAEPLNPNPKPERKTFDAVLKQLCETPPLPREKVKTGKKKLGKILGK